MHRIFRAATALILLCIGSSFLAADIRLPKIFSDKMVLQRGSTIRVWGTADANEPLQIALGDQSTSTTADDQGKWSAEITAPPAGGPYELSVAGKESRVVFSDVSVGEVWLCSGQSNMNWSMEQSLTFENDEARDKYFAEVNNPNVRLFTVPANSIDEEAYDFTEAIVWQECTAGSVSEFSAVAYQFALSLQKNEKLRDMPIGLIDASWGGTPAESWTSRGSLEQQSSLAPLLKHWDENLETRSPHRPASLFNGMIAPLVPMSIRGVIWYQGEANVGRGHQYQTLLPTLIRDWRSRFDQGEFPFYFVQLAPFRYQNHDPRALAELWDAQRLTLEVPNTAMAGSSDIGNPADIHPKNKDVVGDRLARIALSQIYGDVDLEWSGPVYHHHQVDEQGRFVRIHFEHGKGLRAEGDSLSGFLICGEDHEFRPAQARIEDDTVVVWSEDVVKPVAVRYLWNDTAVASLFNGVDLPAIPFRTDNFERLSVDQDF